MDAVDSFAQILSLPASPLQIRLKEELPFGSFTCMLEPAGPEPLLMFEADDIDPDDAENTDGMLAVLRKQVKLAPELTAVYQILEPEPQDVIRIGEKLAETMGEKTDEKKLMVLLMRLCMEKLAVQVTPGSFALLQFGPNQV